MRTLLTFCLLLKVSFCLSQINYCDNCGIFENDNPESYQGISEIHTTTFKGNPVFDSLDKKQKEKLLEQNLLVKYNTNGKVTEYKEYKLLLRDTLKDRYVYLKYNHKNQVSSLVSGRSSLGHKETFQYDDEKNNAVHYIMKYDGVEVNRIVKYDMENGRVINRKEYFGDGNLYKEDNYKYDSKGNQTFKNSYGVKTNTTYKYDSNGQMTLKKSVNKSNKGYQIKYKYNEKNQLLEEVSSNINGKLISKITYEYEKDLMKKRTEISYSGNEIYQTEIKNYIFDENGIWITEKTLVNDIIVSVRERQITYR